MGTAKWRLALWRYNLKIWARKREGERRSDLNDEHCLAGPGLRALRAEEGRSVFFVTTLGFPAGVFPAFWELVFSRQLLSGVEKACRYVDRTGYQRTTSGLCSKMPPTAIWRLFVHTPIAGATDSDRSSRRWVPLLPRWVFLRWRQGKVKRERLKLLDLKTYCQFCSHKRKTVLLVQSDAGLERKKLSKGVCIRVVAFLPMAADGDCVPWYSPLPNVWWRNNPPGTGVPWDLMDFYWFVLGKPTLPVCACKNDRRRSSFIPLARPWKEHGWSDSIWSKTGGCRQPLSISFAKPCSYIKPKTCTKFGACPMGRTWKKHWGLCMGRCVP